jgi:hypothetical protein
MPNLMLPSALLLLRHRLELIQELSLRQGASEWVIDGFVRHLAVSHEGDDDIAPDVFAPPAAVNGDGG